MGDGATNTTQILLFGHPQIDDPSDPSYAFVSKRKIVDLLAYLALHRSTPVARDTVAFALWPDETEDVARANLRRNLHLLGQSLPKSAAPILVQGETLAWNAAGGVWLDVAAFEDAHAGSDYARAAEIHRGELVAGNYDEWLLEHRERLERKYHDALTQLVRAYRTRRDFARAANYATQLLEEDPWREDIVRHLIAIRYESGDRAAALRCYDEFAGRLRDEMNVDPMPETQVLRDAILRSRATSDDGPVATIDLASASKSRALTLPFVGRERELTALHTWWNRTAVGAAATVFVSGEAGIGKTSLVSAFAARVGDEGGRVLTGGTSSSERYPYQAVLDALGNAPSLVVSSSVEKKWLSIIAPLIPELRMKLDATTEAIDPQRERTRLFEAIANVLESLTKTRPLVLIAEDIHWAGAATLDLLSFLSNRLSARTLLVITYRDEQVPRGSPLHGLRKEMTARASAATISLAPLTREHVAEIVESVPSLNEIMPASRTEWHDQSAGNPLFLSELVRDVLERGAELTVIPAKIGDAISERLKRLSEESRGVADLAAVMGDTVDLEVMSAASGREEEHLLRGLAELLDRNILRETFDRANLRYAFTHQLIRRTLYGEIPENRRRGLHRVMAHVLERSFPDRLNDFAAEIAKHYYEHNERERGATWYLRAANAALNIFANAEAAERATLALPHADDRTKIDLLRVRVAAMERLGRQDLEREDLFALRDAAAAFGDDEALAEALERLARSAIDAGSCAEALSYVDRLRALASGEDDIRSFVADELTGRIEEIKSNAQAAALLDRAIAGYRRLGDRREITALGRRAINYVERARFDEAEFYLSQAVRAVESVEDNALRMEVLNSACHVWMTEQRWKNLAESAQDMLRLAVQIGDRRGEADAHSHFAVAATRAHELAAANEAYARALSINRSIGDRVATASALMNLATLRAVEERWSEGLEILGEAQTLAVELHHRRLEAMCEINRAECLYHYSRDYRATREAAERALAIATEIDTPYLCSIALNTIGACAQETGDLVEALKKQDESASIQRRLGMKTSLAVALENLIKNNLEIGENARALAAADELVGLYESGVTLYEPGAELWQAARAYYSAGKQDKAAAVLRIAHDEVKKRVDALGESASGKGFTEAAWCVDLLAAVNEGVWRTPAAPAS